MTDTLPEPEHITPQTLLANDPASFESLYNMYYLPLFYFIKKRVEDVPQAEDIAAESFVKLWQQATQKAGIRNVKAFLYATARNACLDYLKTTRLHQQKEEELYGFSIPSNDELMLAEVRAEVLQHIYGEIEKLPPKCRKIFKLAYVDGLKNNEIADMLAISEQTVSNQKTNALRILRKTFLHKEVWLQFIILLPELKSLLRQKGFF